jgi:hypothetical protein
MELFIKVSLGLTIVGVLARFLALVVLDYPRCSEITRGEEAIYIVLGLCWLAWGRSVL